MEDIDPRASLLKPLTSSQSSSFTADGDDIRQINGVNGFFQAFLVESKKLWYLAAPAVFTSVCQYSLGAITQVFAGHVGTLELAAVSVENSVVALFTFGILAVALGRGFTHCAAKVADAGPHITKIQ